MAFTDIIGQDRAVGILRSALAAESLPHAYVFYGAQGVGRYRTALALARAIVCRSGGEESCDTCLDCKRVDGENHPDFLVVRPLSRKGNKEAVVDPELGAIRIDQIRELQRWVVVRSFMGGWRVVVLDGADKANPAASNALLKTLEEPPPKTLLILISPSRTQLLPTIVSRCQSLYFPPVPREILESVLRERMGDEATDLSLVAALAEGSVGKAVGLDLEWVFHERRQWIERLRDFLGGGRGESFVDFAEEISRTEQMMDVLDLYRSWYRDMMIFNATGDGERLLNQDFSEEIFRDAGERDATDWISGIEAISRAKKDIRYNLNARMVMEDLLLRLADGRKYTERTHAG